MHTKHTTIYVMIHNRTKKYERSNKVYTVSVSSNNNRHLVPKTFIPLHSTSLHLSTLHSFPFKLYPSTLHCTSLPSHLA